VIQSVANISRAGATSFYQLSTLASSSYSRLGIKAPCRTVIILGLTLAVLQILDGILTAIGIQNFGTTAEGNWFLKTLMEQIGYGPALWLTKSIAIIIITTLCMLSRHVIWLQNALVSVIFIYLGAAIIPWTVIILTHCT